MYIFIDTKILENLDVIKNVNGEGRFIGYDTNLYIAYLRAC